jgi:hypothetical protein
MLRSSPYHHTWTKRSKMVPPPLGAQRPCMQRHAAVGRTREAFMFGDLRELAPYRTQRQYRQGALRETIRGLKERMAG